MAEPEHVLRDKLARVFARQDFYQACVQQDGGAIVRICMDGKVTQGQLASLTGIAQSTLSNYARGKNDAKWASTLEKLANGLDMPPRLRQALLGLTGDASRNGSRPAVSAVAGVPADTFDLHLLAEALGRNGTNVKRRDMLALAAQLGAAAALAQTDAWERLAHALARPGAADETLVRQMEARSAGFYLLEEMAPAQAVLRALTVHLREVSTLLHAGASGPGDDLRRRLIVTAGESSLLAGWSASALGDSGAARNFYDTAITAADEAGDPAMTACALTYRSYIPSAHGANGRARVLLAQALDNTSDQASPATAAWVAARHAEESALVGDKSQALESLQRAEEAYSITDPDEDRVWTRFLNQDRFDTFRIATYLKAGKLDDAQQITAALRARPALAEGKTAAVIRENIAAAHLARGSVTEAARIGQAGLAVLRETEFAMWLPKFEAIAKGLVRFQRQPQVRAYLEEFAMAKRQFAPPPR
jgi:transcriptional regulator with XRE-family HTH domain